MENDEEIRTFAGSHLAGQMPIRMLGMKVLDALNLVVKNIIPSYFVVTKSAAFIIIILLAATLGGCLVAPSEPVVAKAITDYFESNHYKVVDLKIGKIEGTPLSERTYMGTPGYIVDVISITLEPKKDKSVDIKRGKQLVFTSASIRVRQDAANKNMWHVSIISGISAP